jgi:deoxyribodipyrimidine photo-lyase
MTALVWYRNDLRVHDHQALAAAMASRQPVRALYLLCPGQWEAHQVAPLRRWYVLSSLRELGEALAVRGIALDLIDCGDFAGVPQALADYCRRHQVSQLFCTREYPLNELRRDRAVADVLSGLGIALQGFDDSVLVPPRALKTGQGTPYTVFTPYRRRWQHYLDEQPPAPPAPPRKRQAVAFPGDDSLRKAQALLDIPGSLQAHWPPGEAAARRRLQGFVREGLAGYKTQRDFPAQPGTSLLSAALSAGTLSAKRCYVMARQAMARDAEMGEGASVWIGELAWRDFYRQIMANFPRLAWGDPFREETRWLQWQRDEKRFQAWCEGRTGYPLVDAAMRQLNQTGWMHNRLRMVTAMFLTKHLFIDWRWGEAYFMRQLLDGDFAANNGGWQWSASTGTDAAPYFRVFSPIRQSERFDPDGVFIKQYVPELRALTGKALHQPWVAPMLAPDYPAPIVRHEGVRERVTAAFQQARDMAAQLGTPHP